MSLSIGVVLDPESWTHWEQAKAYLEPARARGDFATVWEPDELLWAVMDGDELLACATAWKAIEFVEVKLVGGKDRHRWLAELDRRIGAAARNAGAKRLTAWGRRGWTKELRALGWEVFRSEIDTNCYVRELAGDEVE